MEGLTQIKKVVDLVIQWCCIIILGIMTVLVTFQVITRYFFNSPSAISENSAQYLFVWMIMFGSAYVFGLQEHLSITVLKDKMAPLTNLIVDILINILLFVFAMAVCTIGGYNGAMNQMGTVDAALRIPMGVIYIAIPICGVVMLFYAVYNICLCVHTYKTGSVSSTSGNGGGNSTM